jgi:uncharacterized protein (TIGR02996 family)
VPRYEIVDQSGGRFWEITLVATRVTTRTGPLGAGMRWHKRGLDANPYRDRFTLHARNGRTQQREYPSPDAARVAYEKAIARKKSEGFRLVDGFEPSAAAPPTLQEPALEAAIVAAPDEIAPYLVYADWLQAAGDPRGAFITQAREMLGEKDPARFMVLKKEQNALLAAHQTAWLGAELVERLACVKLDWHLGFLRRAVVALPTDAPALLYVPDAVEALIAAPVAICLRELTVTAPDFDEICVLLRGAGLACLDRVTINGRPL